MTLRQDTTLLRALVAFGANLPADGRDPAETVQSAIEDLRAEGLAPTASRLFLTPCFPAGAGPDYVNAAAVVTPRAGQGPGDLLALLHRIEARHGRERQARWAGRTLDLDLLAWGDSVRPDAATQDAWRLLPPEDQARQAPDRLILPHPRLQDRAFVLVPLAEVAPDWVHPRTGLSVAQMLAALPQADREAVKPL